MRIVGLQRLQRIAVVLVTRSCTLTDPRQNKLECCQLRAERHQHDKRTRGVLRTVL